MIDYKEHFNSIYKYGNNDNLNIDFYFLKPIMFYTENPNKNGY